MATPRNNEDIPISVLRDYLEYRAFFGAWKSHKTSVADRIYGSLVPVPGRTCMISSYAGNNDGYIQMEIGDRSILMHRVMWALTYGEWPPIDRVVRHRCDTPKCIAPGCLELGTHKQNTADMMARGRHRAGHGRLKDDVVAKIRGLRETGMAHHVIARELGVSRRAVKSYAP